MKLLPGSLAQIKGYWTAYVVLFLALALTFAGYIGHSRYMTTREQARFAQGVPEVLEQTRARLGIYLAMMKGARALFSAVDRMTPDKLARYFEVLKVHDAELNRGMDGMGVIWKVPPGLRDAHEKELRLKYPHYTISREHPEETIYPIIHFEATGTNASRALGWNVAEDQLRREVIQQAERTREPAISPRTELFYPDGSRGSGGFVMYLPIFDPAAASPNEAPVVGFVFGAFDSDKLFRNIFTSTNRMATLEIFDGTNLRPENLLYDQDGAFHTKQDAAPLMAATQSTEVFGRTWSYYLHTHEVFENSLERRIPVIMMTIGTIGSFLLFGFVFAQIAARERAERFSRELRASESALRNANGELALKVEEAGRSSDELAKSLSLHLATLESTGDGILVVDKDGKVVSHNRRFIQMWRLPETMMTPGIASARLIEHVREQLVDAGEFVARVAELNQNPVAECCDLIDFRDGRVFERHSRPQRIGSEVIGRVMSFRDVTEQRRATDKIAAEKDRLAVTLDSISDGVVGTGRNGCVLLMNPVAEQMCGVSESGVLGMNIEKVFPLHDPQTKTRLPMQLDRFLADDSLEQVRPAALLINAMGKQIMIRHRAAPTHNSAGEITGAVFVFRDVSGEQKAEQELIRASKLESIGLLAGGIAHDFNNVLTGIVGNLSLLKEHPGLSTEVTERLSLLERSAYKARQLTMQLLTFAKGGSPIKQAASIVEVIHESAEFALRGSNVKAEFDFAPDLAVVEIDTGQMSQVVQNLVINAKHAMPDGGMIRVSARNVELTGRENLPLQLGRYVKVSLEDRGCGISPENLSKIFDPYFTTKEKGSGLGLATAYSILKRHEGLITVESEVGKGTTFHLYLPASKATAVVNNGDTSIIPRGAGAGRILAMDDEPGIRTLLSAILKHFGYEITTVCDGAEAIRVYKEARESGQPYCAVIMDLTIPGGMGGRETIRALRELEPNIKAIVSSGYSNDPVLADYRSYGFIARVEKPYRMQELGKTLRNVLQPEESRST